MTEYQRGLHAAMEAMNTLTRTWLDENRHLAEEDQLGYPPFHYQVAHHAIRDLLVAVPVTSADTPEDQLTAMEGGKS